MKYKMNKKILLLVLLCCGWLSGVVAGNEINVTVEWNFNGSEITDVNLTYNGSSYGCMNGCNVSYEASDSNMSIYCMDFLLYRDMNATIANISTEIVNRCEDIDIDYITERLIQSLDIVERKVFEDSFAGLKDYLRDTWIPKEKEWVALSADNATCSKGLSSCQIALSAQENTHETELVMVKEQKDLIFYGALFIVGLLVLLNYGDAISRNLLNKDKGILRVNK